jgi:hypothetical protein
MNESESPRALYMRLKALDLELKALRAAENSKSNVEEIARMSEEVRNMYCSLMSKHFVYVAEHTSGWDIHKSLWLSCFYTQIEEYRNRMKRCLKVLNKEETTPGSVDAALLNKARIGIAKVVRNFDTFLSHSIVFYQDLMLKLEKALKTVKDGNRNGKSKSRKRDELTIDSSQTDSKDMVPFLMHDIYRCLLYLGDLARYSEQNADRREKDFSEARRYYERAAFVDPSNGNPHNQLAVLATYCSAECVAVSHYCRSVLVNAPFLGGYDNLRVSFSRNHKAYLSAKENTHNFEQSVATAIANNLVSTTNAVSQQAKRIAPDSLQNKLWLIRFVRSHGVLFDWSELRLKNAEKAATVKSVVSIGNEEDKEVDPQEALSSIRVSVDTTLTSSEFLTDVSNLFQEFNILLFHAVYGDSLLIKMMIICVFSVHQSVPPHLYGAISTKSTSSSTPTSAMNTSTSDSPTPVGNSQLTIYTARRTKGESMSLIILFEFVNCILMRMKEICEDKSANKRSYLNRLMVIISVYCEWAQAHPQYLMKSGTLSGRSLNTDTSSADIYASESLLDKENTQRALLRTSLITLLTCLENNNNDGKKPKGTLWVPNNNNNVNSKKTEKPLKEHVELRGFLPFQNIYDKYFIKTDEYLPQLPNVATEEQSKDRRMAILKTFVKEWVIPCAKQEANAIVRNTVSDSTDKAIKRGVAHATRGKVFRNEKKKKGDIDDDGGCGGDDDDDDDDYTRQEGLHTTTRNRAPITGIDDDARVYILDIADECDDESTVDVVGNDATPISFQYNMADIQSEEKRLPFEEKRGPPAKKGGSLLIQKKSYKTYMAAASSYNDDNEGDSGDMMAEGRDNRIESCTGSLLVSGSVGNPTSMDGNDDNEEEDLGEEIVFKPTLNRVRSFEKTSTTVPSFDLHTPIELSAYEKRQLEESTAMQMDEEQEPVLTSLSNYNNYGLMGSDHSHLALDPGLIVQNSKDLNSIYLGLVNESAYNPWSSSRGDKSVNWFGNDINEKTDNDTEDREGVMDVPDAPPGLTTQNPYFNPYSSM